MVIGISLGWNCSPSILGVEQGYRKQKQDAYKTCPFDEMISNYEGVVHCIQEDFQDFCTPEFLELKQISNESKYCQGDLLIYNTKYRFLFNHESPGHANLWKDQGWPGGKCHYIENNYEKFIERYSRRIQNFRTYLQSGEEIVFLVIPPREDNYIKLRTVLSEKYPTVKYSIVSFPFSISEDYYKDHMELLRS